MTSFKPSDELKQKLYVIIFKSDTKGGKLFDVLLLIVIVFSVLLSMLESIVEYDKQYLIPFRIGEWIRTFLFTIEYILRIYCVPNKKKYIFSFYGIIDFLSILPAFISILFSSTRYFSIIRSLRLLRIFRILKLSRYVKESNHLAESIKRGAKKILLFSYFIIIMVTILGAIMYVVESKVNPGFGNIPESVYWAVVTLTTVGYGDITPVTFLGQLIATVIMLLGYSIIAVPTGIVSSEMIRSHRMKDVVCLKCGNQEHDRNAFYCHQCGSRLPISKSP